MCCELARVLFKTEFYYLYPGWNIVHVFVLFVLIYQFTK